MLRQQEDAGAEPGPSATMEGTPLVRPLTFTIARHPESIVLKLRDGDKEALHQLFLFIKAELDTPQSQ
jgi:hypothetical protein